MFPGQTLPYLPLTHSAGKGEGNCIFRKSNLQLSHFLSCLPRSGLLTDCPLSLILGYIFLFSFLSNLLTERMPLGMQITSVGGKI